MKNILGILLIILSCISIVSATEHLARGNDWNMYQFNNGTRTYNNSIIISAILNVSTSFSSYTTSNDVRASPTVANSYVYVGNTNGRFYRFSAERVSNLIDYIDLGAAIYSSALVANSYVYVGVDNNNLYQINATNLSQIKNIYTGSNYFDSSPIIVNEWLYINNHFGQMLQLNATNISLLKNSIDIGTSNVKGLAYHNNSIYVTGNAGTYIYQLNATNVSLIQSRYSIPANTNYDGVAICDNFVYFIANKKLYKLNANNLTFLVESSPDLTIYNAGETTPACANGFVYATTQNTPGLYQFNATNISQGWIASVSGSTGGNIRTSPAIANGYVYVGGSNNQIVQLNATNINQTIGKYTGLNVFRSSPTVANGYLYIGSDDNKLYQQFAHSFLWHINNYSYSSSTYESSNETFTLNLSYDTSYYSSISARLVYNQTEYNSSRDSFGSPTIFSKSINISNAGNNSFYWALEFTNSSGSISYYNSSVFSQIVNNLSLVTVATSCPQAAYRFDTKDEDNLTTINLTINYNIEYGIGNTSFRKVYGTLTNINTFFICLNTTGVPGLRIGQGQIFYSSTGYAPRRFYIFGNSNLTNQTSNISIFSLTSANAQAFTFTAKDTGLNPYPGYLLSLLRWYPELNTYNVVEMAKTDDIGSSIMSVKLNTVDYRLALYSTDGVLINILNPLQFSCSALPCTYSMTVNQEQSFVNMLNVQSLLTYNNNTGTFTYIWSDASQTTTLMNLTVYQDNPTYSLILCSSSSTGFTGVLACDVSAYQGILRAEVYRSASPSQPIANLIVTVGDFVAGINQYLKLFIGFIIGTFLVMIGVYISPIAAILFTILAAVFSMFFGIINWYIVAGFIVLAIAVYNVLKRIS